jgi:hypothetical protein
MPKILAGGNKQTSPVLGCLLWPCRLPEGADLMQIIRSQSLITVDSQVMITDSQLMTAYSHAKTCDFGFIACKNGFFF